MIVKPNFRALFKGFSPLKCQPKGVSAKFNSGRPCPRSYSLPFLYNFWEKGNSSVYLPLKNGTPCENTDEKGGRGIKNNKNNCLIDKRVCRSSSVSKWKDLCLRQQRRLLRKELWNDICDQVSLLLLQVRIAYFREGRVRFSSFLFLVW